MWNMPHGKTCTRHSVSKELKFCSWNSQDHRNHQTSLSWARDGRSGRNDQKRMIMHFLKRKHHADFDFIHRSAWWRVGRIFCGYLILRFFPNRKNSQNILPANNSNNKVGDLVPYRFEPGLFQGFSRHLASRHLNLPRYSSHVLLCRTQANSSHFNYRYCGQACERKINISDATPTEGND